MKTIDEVLKYIEKEADRVYDFKSKKGKTSDYGDILVTLGMHKRFLNFCKKLK